MIAGYVGGAALHGGQPATTRCAQRRDVRRLRAAGRGFFVHERAPSLRQDKRTSLLRETAEGYSVVFRNRVMRAVALVVFGAACFGAVPEGLAAAWSAQFPEAPPTPAGTRARS